MSKYLIYVLVAVQVQEIMAHGIICPLMYDCCYLQTNQLGVIWFLPPIFSMPNPLGLTVLFLDCVFFLSTEKNHLCKTLLRDSSLILLGH
jgi:hypothetical protein